MPWKFENAAPVLGHITEGNCWDGEAMLFSNIAMSRIMRLDVNSGLLTVWRENTEGANGLNFDSKGNLYGCSGDGRKIVRFDSNRMTTIVDSVDGARINGPNDLAITPSGSIYFSDRAGDINPNVGIEYSAVLSAEQQDDGTWTCVRRTFDATMPNGVLFSKDYKTLYVAQSDYRTGEQRALLAYPVKEDGSLGAKQVLHDFGRHRGIDGMTLTDDGLIVACTGWELSGPGGCITVFEPDGRIVAQHKTPAKRPTNCTFGGADLTDLYISSIEGHTLLVRNSGLKGYLLYPN
ncbi:MAG: SMP-30/gluconolactonase/LRE family protein [Chloroflexi bacterium]|nr:SMP-30/gluconolactonase/LRE family protein [Chloroflexota bacterium]